MTNGGRRLVTVADVADMITSGATPTVGRAELYSDPQHGLPFFRIQNIGVNHLLLSDLKYVTPEVHNGDLRRSRIRPGDVLMTITGRLGTATVVPSEISEGNINQHICLIRLKKSIANPQYVAFHLNSEETHEEIMRKQHGATRIALNHRTVGSLRISLPPMDVQEKIASTLERCQVISGMRGEANDLTKEIVNSVFLKMFGNPSTNPKGWESALARDVCSKITDGEHITPRRTSTGVMLLSARNVKDGYIDLEEEVDHIPKSEYERIRKRCNPEYGDVLLSCSGTVGRAAVVDIREPFTLVRSVALLKPRRDRVTPEYLQGFLQSESAQGEIRRRANQSSQANIFQRQIRSLNILVPPLDLQAGFSGFVASLKMTIERQKESARALDELFQSLMHKAFRGELTVA
jgi:type I restriction enzyme, S subunit